MCSIRELNQSELFTNTTELNLTPFVWIHIYMPKEETLVLDILIYAQPNILHNISLGLLFSQARPGPSLNYPVVKTSFYQGTCSDQCFEVHPKKVDTYSASETMIPSRDPHRVFSHLLYILLR